MLKSKALVLFFVSCYVVTEGKPGLFDLFTGHDCKPITDDSCAIVYDDEDCDQGDWDPIKIKADGKPVSFSTLSLNPLTSLNNARKKNDIESLVVRKGCTLTVYDDSGCTSGKSYTFQASNSQDLIVEDLEDSDAEDFDEDIECLKCSCNTFLPSKTTLPARVDYGPPRPETCPEIPAGIGAIAWDGGDCVLDSWSSPVSLRNGEDKAWNLLSDASAYAEFANTIESVCVKKGCNLTVFDDGDFSDDPFSFVATDYDLCVTLDNPPSSYSVSQRAQIKGLDDSIRSMTLRCK